MSTSPVSCCWTMAATRPAESRRSRVASCSGRGEDEGVDTLRILALPPRVPRNRARGQPTRSSPCRPPGLRCTVSHYSSFPLGGPLIRHARAERSALCDTLLRVGPDVSTLCGDWTSADLLAHLLVRE